MVKLKGLFDLFPLLIPATVLGTGVQSIRQEGSRGSACRDAVRRESPTILPERQQQHSVNAKTRGYRRMFVMCKWRCHILMSCGV